MGRGTLQNAARCDEQRAAALRKRTFGAALPHNVVLGRARLALAPLVVILAERGERDAHHHLVQRCCFVFDFERLQNTDCGRVVCERNPET